MAFCRKNYNLYYSLYSRIFPYQAIIEYLWVNQIKIMAPKSIDNFFKRHTFDYIMYGHVSALIANLPTITVGKAILNFLSTHNISEEDMPIEAIKATYYRIQKDYFESQKTKPNEQES